MNKEHAMVTRSSCNDCVHKLVCSYKEDFHDVYNAVAGANVHKYMDNGKVKIINVLAYNDILDEIIIKCKHYCASSGIRMDSNGGITVQFHPFAPDVSTSDSANTS